MREIKFRAWCKPTKFMWNWGRIKNKEFAGNGLDFMIDNDEWVLMQYTGLKDKNGKEIYEGDILKTPQGNRVVEWDLNDGWRNVGRYFGNVEVIGNIYENPKLKSK